MKQILLFLIITSIFTIACERDKVYPQTFYDCESIGENPAVHPENDSYISLIDAVVSSGVPGMQFSVQDPENSIWNGSGGLADLASNIPLKPCNITRVGSTVKTFTAVAILLLQEDGGLALDDPITKYLSSHQIRGLKNAKQSTIRQLLNHTSGIFNYIQSAQFQTTSLNDLTRVWQPDELLEYARDKDPYFEIGTDALYSNTNYILLGWIIEKVTGKPFYQVFEERIFIPLGLNFTRFAAEDPIPEGIIQGYVDFYSNLNIINSTEYSGWDYFSADGGLISNSNDLNIFLHALFNNEFLQPESLDEMIQWIEPKEQASDGFKTYYGLGIFRIETEYGPAYIHSGDAIGYFASMVHFPNQNVTITWAVNGNYGKLDERTQSKATMEKIFQAVLD